jgi:hypothetical protein
MFLASGDRVVCRVLESYGVGINLMETTSTTTVMSGSYGQRSDLVV